MSISASMALADAPVVKAAGGILQRSTPRGDEVMVVYRKLHQDWTLPKGKVNEGESFEEAALRQVQFNTGCSCQLGRYLGTISYSDAGIPRVASFWRMSLVQQRPLDENEEIGEAAWLPIASAIERLSHPQEKALLLRLANASRAYQPPEPEPSVPHAYSAVPAERYPVPQVERPPMQPGERVPVFAAIPKEQVREPAAVPPPRVEPASVPPAPVLAVAQPAPPPQTALPIPPSLAALAMPAPKPGKKRWFQDDRTQSRLLWELESFKVELSFLEKRSEPADKTWVAAATEQLENVKRHLEANDIEGAWFCFHAAQRYCVFGLTRAELASRACALREEAHKITSWRGEAIKSLLSVTSSGTEQLTATRVADAMALRNEHKANQYGKFGLAGDQLTVFLLICALAFAAFVPFVLRSGEIRLIATLMLFGLLGAAFSAVQSMMKERNDLRIPERVANYFVTVTRVLFGAVVAVAAAALYESLVLNVNIGDPKMVLALCVSFLVGCIGERLLARIAESMSDRRSRS